MRLCHLSHVKPKQGYCKSFVNSLVLPSERYTGYTGSHPIIYVEILFSILTLEYDTS